MAFLIRRTQELAQLDTASKVIKANDFWQYQQARDVMSSAKEKRDQILDASLAGFEAEQSRGYRQGRDEARQEQAQKMIGIISQTVDYFSKIEAQMVDLVLDAVRRIIDDFNDREKILKVVRNALTMVRNQRQLLIRVHPVNVAEIKSQVNELKQSFPGIDQMEVSPDVNLDKDACVIESDMGQVEASMSGQMEALKASFGRVFGTIPETGKDRKSVRVGTN